MTLLQQYDNFLTKDAHLLRLVEFDYKLISFQVSSAHNYSILSHFQVRQIFCSFCDWTCDENQNSFWDFETFISLPMLVIVIRWMEFLMILKMIKEYCKGCESDTELFRNFDLCDPFLYNSEKSIPVQFFYLQVIS